MLSPFEIGTRVRHKTQSSVNGVVAGLTETKKSFWFTSDNIDTRRQTRHYETEEPIHRRSMRGTRIENGDNPLDAIGQHGYVDWGRNRHGVQVVDVHVKGSSISYDVSFIDMGNAKKASERALIPSHRFFRTTGNILKNFTWDRLPRQNMRVIGIAKKRDSQVEHSTTQVHLGCPAKSISYLFYVSMSGHDGRWVDVGKLSPKACFHFDAVLTSSADNGDEPKLPTPGAQSNQLLRYKQCSKQEFMSDQIGQYDDTKHVDAVKLYCNEWFASEVFKNIPEDVKIANLVVLDAHHLNTSNRLLTYNNITTNIHVPNPCSYEMCMISQGVRKHNNSRRKGGDIKLYNFALHQLMTTYRSRIHGAWFDYTSQLLTSRHELILYLTDNSICKRWPSHPFIIAYTYTWAHTSITMDELVSERTNIWSSILKDILQKNKRISLEFLNPPTLEANVSKFVFEFNYNKRNTIPVTGIHYGRRMDMVMMRVSIPH